MHPDLGKLILLQKADADLKRAEAEFADVPAHKAAVLARLVEERLRVDQAREALAGSQKNRRQHEAALQDLESKRSKYKGQLMDVKTNKEYTAMLHEIENVEREIRTREDQVLEEMEAAESLGAALKHEESVFKAAEQRHHAELQAAEGKLALLQGEVVSRRALRDELAAGVSADALELYARVAKLRGSAVAEVKDAMCQVCHVKLRPQMYVDLKRNESIVQCPSCSRIVYFEPPVPVAAQEP